MFGQQSNNVYFVGVVVNYNRNLVFNIIYCITKFILEFELQQFVK